MGENPLQLGGGLVVAPPNQMLFTYVSETFGDSAPIEEMVLAVEGWSKGSDSRDSDA